MPQPADTFLLRSLTLRHLRLLLALDSHRQVRLVAEAQHISQPAVSKALAEIESGIGAPLFERTPKGLVPTARGACLVRYAQIVTGEIGRAAEELAGIARGISSTVSVGVMHGCTSGVVPAAVALCRERQPGLVAILIEGSIDHLMQQLRAGRLDLVVGAKVERAMPAGMQFSHLYDEPLAVVCGVQHPLAAVAKVEWQDLMSQPWVLPPRYARARDALELNWRRMGLPLPDVAVETLSTDLIQSLLSQAPLLAILAEGTADKLAAPGLVRRLHPEPQPPVMPIGTLRSAGASDASAAPLFEACLAKVVGRR